MTPLEITAANQLMADLSADVSFEFPVVDFSDASFQFPFDSTSTLYQAIEPVSVGSLTDRTVGGTGVFDALMASAKAHIKDEFDNNRIVGSEYAKTYIAVTEVAMSNAVQFLLQKDNAKWAAINAQIAAITARVQLETVKANLAVEQFKALGARADYARSKMELVTAGLAADTAKFNLNILLPLAQAEKTVQNQILEYNRDTTLPTQTLHVEKQILVSGLQAETAQYQLNHTLPSQLSLLDNQVVGQDIQNQNGQYELDFVAPQKVRLLVEQVETQRAQTLDTRFDGSMITGNIGKQKDLYSQQIVSYQRDSELKAGKIFADSWITQKTIDESIEAPDALSKGSINTVLTAIKSKNGLS